MRESDDHQDEAQVSDEELIESLRQNPPIHLDSTWHPGSIVLANRFETDKFDLNSWWCLTPADWICPACDRPKPQIVRINQHRELMGHLVEHHDHMDRYIQKRLVDCIGRSSKFVATADSEQFAKRCSPAISAFDPVVVCEDCNNVDAKAKKHVKAHSDFSFTARDIQEFVIARPNEPHQIDYEKLNQVWAFRKPQLERRLELAGRIADLAATNEHWYETADSRHHARQVERASGIHQLSIDRYLSIATSKPVRVPDIKKWRTRKRRKAERPPNDQELRWLSDVTNVGHYSKLPDDWCCPWCERSKFQITRPSKEEKYSFTAPHSWVIDPETRERSKVITCSDCRDVRVRLANEANAQIVAVQPFDVMSIIRPKAHAQHALVPHAEIDHVVKRIRSHAIMLDLSKEDQVFDRDVGGVE